MHPRDREIGQLTIERMTRAEVQIAIDWAQNEGWNPGVHDAECFFHADPAGFYAAKLAGEVVGTISAVQYSADFAFEGLYIVKPAFRGKGIGGALQKFVDDRCKNFNLGLDGVLEMQGKYEEHGFSLAHKNTRYAGICKADPSERCVPIRRGDFHDVAAFDAKFFPAQRPRFLKCWFFQKDARAFMVRKNNTGNICGYGVIRKCIQGHKIGPLFAEDYGVAKALFETFASTVQGEEMFLDVPEPNRRAVQLAEQNGMQPVFSTVRMYTKKAPSLPLDKIYGVTSFELG